jgi:hypothetical protein
MSKVLETNAVLAGATDAMAACKSRAMRDVVPEHTLIGTEHRRAWV